MEFDGPRRIFVWKDSREPASERRAVVLEDGGTLKRATEEAARAARAVQVTDPAARGHFYSSTVLHSEGSVVAWEMWLQVFHGRAAEEYDKMVAAGELSTAEEMGRAVLRTSQPHT